MKTITESGLAFFAWTGTAFEIDVCGYVVATFKTLREVRAFCDMHNTIRQS